MKKIILEKFNYSLFDASGSEAGGAPAQAFTEENAENQSGGDDGGYDKPSEEKGESVAGTEEKSNPSPEDLRAKYDEFMKDERMRSFANEDIQRVINRRFRENKSLHETIDRQSAVMERLIQRFGVDDPEELCKAIDNDNAFWEASAMEAGLDVETYKKMKSLQRDAERGRRIEQELKRRQQAQAQYSRWLAEAEELKGIYPEFDLNAELQNDDFKRIVGQPNAQYPISMRQAYEIIHHDEIVSGIRKKAERETQKRVVDNIKSRGTRPVEGAVSAQGGVTYKKDVTRLTKADREEIAKRAARGEMISF